MTAPDPGLAAKGYAALHPPPARCCLCGTERSYHDLVYEMVAEDESAPRCRDVYQCAAALHTQRLEHSDPKVRKAARSTHPIDVLRERVAQRRDELGIPQPDDR